MRPYYLLSPSLKILSSALLIIVQAILFSLQTTAEERILLKKAVEEDPSNAHAHRVYGDYLMGYRGARGGLYEYAAYHYHQAQQILEQHDSTELDEAKAIPEEAWVYERKRLKRAFDIQNRDGKDGVVLYRSEDFSLSLELSGEYAQESPDPWAMLNQERTIAEFVNRYYPSIPYWIDFVESAPEDLPRRQETKKFTGILGLRFGNPKLPYIRFTGEQVETDESGIDFNEAGNDLGPVFTESKFKRAAITIGKNGILPYEIDWNTELEIDWRSNESYNPVNKWQVEKEDTNAFIFRSALSKSANNRVLKVTFGGSLLEIDNNSSGDDAGNSQNIAFRYSSYAGPTENFEVSKRFRGRRSTHFEAGVRRTERIYKASKNPLPDSHPGNYPSRERFYYPFFTYEEFGLMAGDLDLLFKYRYIDRKFVHHDIEELKEGTFHFHEFTLTPTWVSVYELYDYEVTTGLEHATVSLPLEVVFGDGEYDRVNLGLTWFTRWVFKDFGLDASLSVDYNYYTASHYDDWGGFFKVSLNSGAYSR